MIVVDVALQVSVQATFVEYDHVIQALAANGGWQARPVTTSAQAAPGLVIYRFTHSLYYANCQQLSNEVSLLANTGEPPLRWLCLEASAIDDVDYSAAETLRSVHARLKAKGIRMVVAEVMEDLKTASRYRIKDAFGEDVFYDHLEDAVKQYRKQFNLITTGVE